MTEERVSLIAENMLLRYSNKVLDASNLEPINKQYLSAIVDMIKQNKLFKETLELYANIRNWEDGTFKYGGALARSTLNMEYGSIVEDIIAAEKKTL